MPKTASVAERILFAAFEDELEKLSSIFKRKHFVSGTRRRTIVRERRGSKDLFPRRSRSTASLVEENLKALGEKRRWQPGDR